MTDQLSWLEPDSNQASLVWRLEIDGASRGNPGPAGAGIYLRREAHIVFKQGFFLGSCTNNQAEYAALLLGICQARTLVRPLHTLHIISDSELLVRQLQGTYKVKHDTLHILFTRAQEMLSGISYTVQHVFRAENKIADALANEGIDKKIAIPQELLDQCGIAAFMKNRWKQNLCTE